MPFRRAVLQIGYSLRTIAHQMFSARSLQIFSYCTEVSLDLGGGRSGSWRLSLCKAGLTSACRSYVAEWCPSDGPLTVQAGLLPRDQCHYQLQAGSAADPLDFPHLVSE